MAKKFKFRPLPFFEGGPSIRTMLFLAVFLGVTYFTVQLIAITEERTRNNLFSFMLLGFFLAYYIIQPFTVVWRMRKEAYLFFMILLLSGVAYITFLNNRALDALVKAAFTGYGSMFYLYLKNVLFENKSDKQK